MSTSGTSKRDLVIRYSLSHDRYVLIGETSQHQVWRKAAKSPVSKPGRNCPTGETKKGERKKIRHEDRKKETARYTRVTDEDGRTVWHGLGVSDDSSCFFLIAFFGCNDGHATHPDAVNSQTLPRRISTLPVANTCRYPHTPTYLAAAWAESNKHCTEPHLGTRTLLFIFLVGTKGGWLSFFLVPLGGTDDLWVIPSYNDVFLFSSAVCVYLWLGFNVSVDVRFHT